MYEVIIVKEGTNEMVSKHQILSKNCVIISQGETKPNVIRSFDTLRKDEAHYYQQIYSQVVEKLIAMYPEYIGHISKEKIGFLVDDKWEPQAKATENSAEYINIKRANRETKLYIGFDYEIVMKQYFLEKWDNAQLAAAILSVLLRIDATKGTIKNYGERFQSRLVATFGINYLDDNVSIPDVTVERIHLGEFEKSPTHSNGQLGIDDLPFGEEPDDDFNDGMYEGESDE